MVCDNRNLVFERGSLALRRQQRRCRFDNLFYRSGLPRAQYSLDLEAHQASQPPHCSRFVEAHNIVRPPFVVLLPVFSKSLQRWTSFPQRLEEFSIGMPSKWEQRAGYCRGMACNAASLVWRAEEYDAKGAFVYARVRLLLPCDYQSLLSSSALFLQQLL